MSEQREKRKKWLKTFLDLADSGAPTIEYRKKLRIKIPHLKTHISRLGAYRNEYAEILQIEEEERKVEERRERTRKAREAAAEARAKRAAEAERARARLMESRLSKQKENSTEGLDESGKDAGGQKENNEDGGDN